MQQEKTLAATPTRLTFVHSALHYTQVTVLTTYRKAIQVLEYRDYANLQ